MYTLAFIASLPGMLPYMLPILFGLVAVIAILSAIDLFVD
jgi:hypothetical protein